MPASSRSLSGHLFVGLAVVLTLWIMELATRARLFGAEALLRPQRYTNLLLQGSDMLVLHEDGFSLRPNLDLYYKGARFSTNAHGFRGPMVSKAKPGGVVRIAVLGRSNTMGHGVADAETWPRELERLLNSRGEQRYEVLNFAMSGFLVPMMLRDYERRGRDFGADLVLIEAYGTDLGPQVQPLPLTQTALVPPAKVLLAYSMLVHVVRQAAAMRGVGYWRLPPLRSDPARAAASAEQRPENPRRLLRRFIHRRNAEGVGVALVRLDPVGYREASPLRKRAAQLRELWTARVPEAPWLDTETNGAPACAFGDWIFYGDAHPNARCHARYAAALLDQVLSVLPADPELRRGSEPGAREARRGGPVDSRGAKRES